MRWAIAWRPTAARHQPHWVTLLAAILGSLAAAIAGPVERAAASSGEAPSGEAARQCRIAPASEHVRGWREGDLGCPTDVASPIEAVEQFFELGVMLWRSDVRTVYVLSSQGGTAFYSFDRQGSGESLDRQGSGEQRKASGADDPAWRSFPDHYSEGQPEYAGYSPPDERLQEPVRGFGKVWREQLGGSSARIGWATTYERRVWAAVQSFERGLIVRTDTGRVYVLHTNGTWVSYRL